MSNIPEVVMLKNVNVKHVKSNVKLLNKVFWGPCRSTDVVNPLCETGLTAW